MVTLCYTIVSPKKAILTTDAPDVTLFSPVPLRSQDGSLPTQVAPAYWARLTTGR